MDEKRAQRIEDKLDSIVTSLASQNAVLATHSLLHSQNSKDLEHHIKRTDLLEDSLKPLKQTDSAIRFTLKAIAYAATLLTIAYTIVRLVKGI